MPRIGLRSDALYNCFDVGLEFPPDTPLAQSAKLMDPPSCGGSFTSAGEDTTRGVIGGRALRVAL